LEDRKISPESSTSAPRPSPGRPTREQQQQRSVELLNVALDTFLEQGFDQTTMEAIATRVGMSKRTIYARYEDKSALFRAAVRRAIQDYTVPRSALEAVKSANLAATLSAVARLRIANISTPMGTKLQRILSAQSHRFPELFNEAFEEGVGPTIEFLCEQFQQANARGEIAVSSLQRTAVAFLSLVVSGPSRIIVSGNALDDREISRRIQFAVNLFMNGVRPR
jgi:AcrR family transcriptional regulator